MQPAPCPTFFISGPDSSRIMSEKEIAVDY